MMIIAIVLLSMTVRYKLGFGFSLVFIPLATWLLGFDDAFRTAIVLEVIAGILMTVEFWKYVRLSDAFLLKGFSLVGVGLGFFSERYFSRRWIIFVSMFAVVVSCAYFIRNLKVKVSRNNLRLCISGVTSGFLNSWTSLSGPPVIIYYLKTEQSNNSIKGLLSGYFILLYLFTFGWLVFRGDYSAFTRWTQVAWGGAAVLIGYVPIRRLARRLPIDLDKGALWFILLAAVSVIVKEML
jgi:uncharacterized membrane protein YfcA